MRRQITASINSLYTLYFHKNNRIVVQIIQIQLIIASTHLFGENLFPMFILIWSQIYKWDKYTHTVTKPIFCCWSKPVTWSLGLISNPNYFSLATTDLIFLYSRFTDWCKQPFETNIASFSLLVNRLHWKLNIIAHNYR